MVAIMESAPLGMAMAAIFLTTINIKVGAEVEEQYAENAKSDNGRYIVEVMAVLDKAAIEKWQPLAGSRDNLKKEVESIYFEINKIYENLLKTSPPLHIEIRLCKIEFLDKESDQVLDQDYFSYQKTISGAEMLDEFLIYSLVRKWMGAECDHLQLFTGHEINTDFPDKKAVEKGHAFISSMCQNYSVSVVKATTIYDVAVVAAHEIGHSLGCVHDGEYDANGNMLNRCYACIEMLMSATKNPTTTQKWFWSDCSARSIKNLIATRKPRCIYEAKTTSKAIQADRYGAFVAGNEICRRVGKVTALEMYEPGMYNTDRFCTSIYCVDEWKGDYSEYTLYATSYESSEGMPCGTHSRCYQGACVKNGKATEWDTDYCPLGEQKDLPEEIFKVTSCKHVKNCRHFSDLKNMCCEKCKGKDGM